MTKFKKSFRRGEKGFTLIELLIVVAILGILAAVIIPNVATFMRSGEKAAGQSELAIVQTAVFAMMADNGLGAITSATVKAGQDISPVIASFLQGGLAQLDGEWVVSTTGYITSGDFPDRSGDRWIYTTPLGVATWIWGQP